MSDGASPGWHLGNAPKQSITEVLHNPRGPALELPELQPFDLAAAALSPAPAPPPPLPPPLDINHFEPYLRVYTPLWHAFRAEKARTHHPSPSTDPDPDPDHRHALHCVPPQFFRPDFSVASSSHLAALQPATASPSPAPALPPRAVAELRAALRAHRATLEKAMRLRLNAQAAAVERALHATRALRATLLTSAESLRAARLAAAHLVPVVGSSLRATRAVAAAQSNMRALRDALRALRLVRAAPRDVALLLASAEFPAAIAAVADAKQALARRDLAPVLALAPARASLAQAAEAIDTALRDEFRAALQAPAEASQRADLEAIVELVASMGRLPLLRGFFLKDIRVRLERDLRSIESLPAASKVVTESAARALMLVAIINDADPDRKEDNVPANTPDKYLRSVHDDMEEMLASAADRFLTSFAPSKDPATRPEESFVVISDLHTLTEETCFNEFKAALKFGEEVRALEGIAKELERMFSSERKRTSALRAKISERQNAFLAAFHRAHVDSLTEAVKADNWQELRVPAGALRLLAAVIAEDASESAAASNGLAGNEGSLNYAARAVDGAIVIGPDVFKTVGCGTRYLRSMCAYTLLAEKSPNLAPEIARRATELSRLFNSLIGKAILGAAALQWSGLRSITARHLSLASRTIAMAAALADRINGSLEKALAGAQASVIVPLIQKSERDLRDHHGQLLAKILAIMMDRLEAHETVLKSLPWDKPQEMLRFDVPSAYISTLVKEATVLHRILWSILPQTEVCDIFQRVCAAYGTHLTEAYGSLDGGKEWIRTRVAEDVSCLRDRLATLDVFKVTPSALKPITKLYAQFAKEFKDSENSNESKATEKGRTFFRRREEDRKPIVQTSQNTEPVINGESKRSGEDVRENTTADNATEARAPSTDVSMEKPASVARVQSSTGNEDRKVAQSEAERKQLATETIEEQPPNAKEAPNASEIVQLATQNGTAEHLKGESIDSGASEMGMTEDGLQSSKSVDTGSNRTALQQGNIDMAAQDADDAEGEAKILLVSEPDVLPYHEPNKKTPLEDEEKSSRVEEDRAIVPGGDVLGLRGDEGKE